PVYYCGANSRAGHAFVCDGYSSDGFFHFNWGWGGMSDGYFLLSALDPGSQGIGGSTAGYSYGQVIVTGAQPPKEDSEFTYLMSTGSDPFRPTESTGKMNSTVTFEGGIYNRSIVAIPTSLKINAGVRLTSLSDGSVRYVLSENVKSYANGLEPAYGWSTIRVKFTTSISSGEYLVEPVYSVHNKWEDLLTMYSFNRMACYMTVDGNDLTFSSVRPGFKVSDMTFSPIYLGNQFRVEARFENPGSEEFYSGICGAFWPVDDEDGSQAIGQVLFLDVMPDEDGRITYISDFFRTSDDFAAGDYYFVFVDYVAYLFGDWMTYSEPVKVTVNPAPTEAAKVVCSTLSGSGVVIDDVTTVDVSARVHCTAGYFCAPLYAYVFDSKGNNRGGGASESIFFDKGNSLDVKFPITVDKLNSKLTYQLVIYTLTNGSWNNLRTCNFKVTESSALDDVCVDVNDAPVRYFTPQGVEVRSDCLCPGQVYIRRQGAEVTKIIANR
ncbi:MAG: C10 family peptidase, partial [Muribaculaceae bacterium]|nr:C10 family peptidase [Muribaculaceae bacterium]